MNRPRYAFQFAFVLVGLLVTGCDDSSKPSKPTLPNSDAKDTTKGASLDSSKADSSTDDGGTKKRRPEISTDPNSAFVVADQFSIDTPPNGYKWSLARKVESQGTTGRVYACTKQGSTSAIALTVQERSANTEPARTAAIKAHYNGLVETLRNGGFTELRGQKPPLDSPIPDRVLFSVRCKRPTGEPAYMQVVTAFGKNIYSIQAIAGTLEEWRHFSEVLNSFKELSED